MAQVRLGRTLVREGRLPEAEPHLIAGYEVLVKQTGSSATWLRAAREDLATVFDALKQPEKARQYREELGQ